jgi:putative membrane protein insertion efficiency factor
MSEAHEGSTAPPRESPRPSFFRRVLTAPANALIALVQVYRNYISPMRLPTCRFSPTCSEYAVDALRAHGAVKGLFLAAVRLAKCGPWHPGGWDPVPERRNIDRDRIAAVGHKKRSA